MIANAANIYQEQLMSQLLYRDDFISLQQPSEAGTIIL